MKEFYLRKAVTKKSSAQYWRAEIEGATVRMFHGQEGGKEVEEDPITYTEGKNVGRANETTPEYQCQFETERRVRKKLEKGYELVRGTIEIESATVIVSDLTAPYPMLAKKYKEMEKKIAQLPFLKSQRKLNGNRCMFNLQTGKMFSRERKEITHLVYIRNALNIELAPLREKGVEWVDGELYAHGLTFNQVQHIIRDRGTIQEIEPIDPRKVLRFNLFDYIGEANEGFFKRAEVLEELRASLVSVLITVVETETITPAQIVEKHNLYVSEGYEGIILRLDLPYEEGPSRSSGLVKFKYFEDAEFPVVKFNPEKNNPNKLATITISDKGILTDVTPAMSDEERAYLWDHQSEYIGKMATVKFQNKDAVTGALVFANLMGFRDVTDLPTTEPKKKKG